jgi:NhaA family Na+:H+ antiporter
MRIDPIDKILVIPLTRFIQNSTTSGILLFAVAVLALLLANSPWEKAYHQFWEHTFSIGYDTYQVSQSLHYWINDGLMAIFFFVIGLELKREVMAGKLSRPKDAILPVAAGLGGMLVPALLYLSLNPSGETSTGWGIPMATDIAFALGILYLLGNKAPLSLKLFLTVLAIADDIGAVLVIAFFYTPSIVTTSLLYGGGFLLVLVIGNLLGVRSIVFYGAVGIGGLWLAFLLSGVHATIAGIVVALTIPANVKINDTHFVTKMKTLTKDFEQSTPNQVTLLTHEQLEIVEKIRFYSLAALTPLQRLEHALHPLVAFVVMPIFALANAGITFSGSFTENMFSQVSLGVILGLVVGKFVGIVGISTLLVRFRLASLPEGMTWRHIYGVALLAGVGFTMSLFITDLAFENPTLIIQSKIGIFMASIIGGIGGYLVLKKG